MLRSPIGGFDISIHAPHEGERRDEKGRGAETVQISIHAPHEGERQSLARAAAEAEGISIHAPHEGERLAHIGKLITVAGNFNPRSPRGGATFLCKLPCILKLRFQSTLPTRGSDTAKGGQEKWVRHFNPRSPRGGATRGHFPTTALPDGFQSTLPTRGSDDEQPVINSITIKISIHAPHEGERPLNPGFMAA